MEEIMRNFEHWIFLALVLGWIASLALGAIFGGLIHLLPLCAVLVLINRIRRPQRARAKLQCKKAAAR
jgi:F0F1-type ATP synthase assembly protein I